MSQNLPPKGSEGTDVDGIPNEETFDANPNVSVQARKPKFVVPIWAKIGLMFVIVFIASIGYFRGQNVQESIEQVNDQVSDDQAIERRIPSPQANFTTRDGKSISLTSLQGKVVLLTFWAHWCTPCLAELPSFKTLFERLNSQDFVVAPINLDEKDEGKAFITNFWKDKSIPFESYFDPDKAAAKAFNVDTLPANFVIDRKGRIVMSSFGSNDWSNESTVEMIESLLNEKN